MVMGSGNLDTMTNLLLILLLLVGCETPVEQEDVYGCTDESACNFNSDANIYVPNSCDYDYDDCGVCGNTNDCTGCLDGNGNNRCIGKWKFYSNQITISDIFGDWIGSYTTFYPDTSILFQYSQAEAYIIKSQEIEFFIDSTSSFLETSITFPFEYEGLEDGEIHSSDEWDLPYIENNLYDSTYIYSTWSFNDSLLIDGEFINEDIYSSEEIINENWDTTALCFQMYDSAAFGDIVIDSPCHFVKVMNDTLYLIQKGLETKLIKLND